MVPGVIDYASSYFKYKTSTPIIGEPTNKLVKRFQIELRANASSVETDIGRGNYSYFSLVLMNDKFVRIPNIQPFVAPQYLIILNIPASLISIQELELRDKYTKDKRLYLECKNVKRLYSNTFRM